MQNQSHIIRPVTPADDNALRALYKFSLEKNTQGFVQRIEFHGDIAERARHYQNDNGVMLGVFMDDGKSLIGMGGLKKTENNRVELCNLHVHPHQQGKGIGKRLAQVLIQDAEELGYDAIELHVTATQDAAIGLYQHLGFQTTGRKVFDVEGKDYDTIFMELQLG